jgi:hypothetical protein
MIMERMLTCKAKKTWGKRQSIGDAAARRDART